MKFKALLIFFTLCLLPISLVSAISVNNVELADLGFTGFVVEANLDTSGSAQVLYGKTGALGSATSLASSSNEHLLQVSGLESNTVYFYRVVGEDSSGNSYSSAISLTRTPKDTSSTAQSASITNIKSYEISSSSFKVDWSLSNGATGRVEYGTTSNLGSLTTKENRYLTHHIQSATNLQSGTTYYYRVIGEDANGNNYASDIQTIKTSTSGTTTPTPDPDPTTDPDSDPDPDPDPTPSTPPTSSTISLPSYGSADYYVATNGKTSNSGTSKSSPWTLQKAMSTAKAGDTIFVKAGNYGNIRVTQNNNGRSNAYINFIGTDTNWNPIDSSETGRSFNRGDNIDANKMPLLQGSTSDNIQFSGTAIKINGDYVRLENFQMYKYLEGLAINGDHNIVKNIYSTYHGDYRPGLEGGFENYAGRGMNVYGDYIIMVDSMIQDAGSQGISVMAAHGRYDNIQTYATNNNNDMDYDFLFTKNAFYNYATNINVYRQPLMDHYGHGIVFKSGTGETMYNVVDGFEIANTALEVQFEGTAYNTLRNGVVHATNYQEATNKWYWKAYITVANGAHHNTFKDITVKNTLAAVMFNNWNDGLTGPKSGAGNDNVFIRLTTENNAYVVFFNTHGDYLGGSANNNKFYNSTFTNADALTRVLNRPNSGTEFHNIEMDDIRKLKYEADAILNKNTVFDDITLTDSFSASELTPYQESNIR